MLESIKKFKSYMMFDSGCLLEKSVSISERGLLAIVAIVRNLLSGGAVTLFNNLTAQNNHFSRSGYVIGLLP